MSVKAGKGSPVQGVSTTRYSSVCAVPRVDKYITDFLGRHIPKDRDAELMKIQAAVLAIARPLTSSWQKLQETEAEDGEEILVPVK